MIIVYFYIGPAKLQHQSPIEKKSPQVETIPTHSFRSDIKTQVFVDEPSGKLTYISV